MSASMTVPSGSIEDTLIISGASDISIDLGNMVAAQPVYTIDSMVDTITIDSSLWSNNSITTGGSLSYSQDYSVNSSYYRDPGVNITHEGVNMKEDCDLKIGDRSLKDFMDKVEDQLAILRPAPELEEKWDQLKDLRRQYEALKQDILEKEKIIKILKEQ